MKKNNLEENFKKFVLEVNKAQDQNKENEFMEKLRLLTKHKSIEAMVARFKKLAGIS